VHGPQHICHRRRLLPCRVHRPYVLALTVCTGTSPVVVAETPLVPIPLVMIQTEKWYRTRRALLSFPMARQGLLWDFRLGLSSGTGQRF
jgi:hypothetical protein